MTSNVFNLQVHDTDCFIQTSNGPLTITKKVNVLSNNLFKGNNEFLLHQFSSDYDLLIGRKLLSEAQAVIDYKTQTVTLYNRKYKLTNDIPITNQNHFLAQPNPETNQHFKKSN